jgi:hypothetical protein
MNVKLNNLRMYSFGRGLAKYQRFLTHVSFYRNKYPKTRHSTHGIRKIIYPYLDSGALNDSIILTEYFFDDVYYQRKTVVRQLRNPMIFFEAIEQYYQRKDTKYDMRGINGIVLEFYLNDMSAIQKQFRKQKESL